MNMDEILNQIAGNGVLGLVLVWALVWLQKYMKGMIDLVRDNTAAMNKMAAAVDNLEKVIDRKQVSQ